MEQIIEFAVTVIIISASGVMTPGPLFAANIAYGLQGGGKVGIKMAVGHTIVELPLVILLGIGVFSFEIIITVIANSIICSIDFLFLLTCCYKINIVIW